MDVFEGALTVLFKVKFCDLSKPINSTRPQAISQKTNGRKKLALIYEQQDLTDIIIKTVDKIFKAHRVVLASQSSVFKKKFKIQMRERRENAVEVIDIQPAVMSDLLTYFCTGSAPNIKTLAKDLLLAADKFNVRV